MYKKLREKHVDLAMMLSTCVEFIVMNVSSSSSESSEEKLKEEVKEDLKSKVKKEKDTTSRERVQERLQRAIDDTESALVPVRAHGLAVMCRTISNRSNRDVVDSMYVVLNIYPTFSLFFSLSIVSLDYTTRKSLEHTHSIMTEHHQHSNNRYENLIKSILIQISDDESYVYLNAVNALVALCDRFTNRTLKRLFEELSIGEIRNDVRWLQQKLRVVEVLDRVIERLGEMLPPHAPRLVSVLMSVSQVFRSKSEQDVVRIASTIRASSLSALGTVCNTLQIGSVPNLAQIFRLCSNAILETLERNVNVRRAAANLLHFLVIGRDHADFFSVSEELKGIYTVLRRVESSDSDMTTRRLVSSAAYEIDEIMKNFLLSSSGNSKKREFHIRVL